MPCTGCTCRNMAMGARQGEEVGVLEGVLEGLGVREGDGVLLALWLVEGEVGEEGEEEGTGVLL